ncbi:SDR family oxidoreductase [Haloactinospora alba]|uniref:SDR family oxidoreductase n=1 Tax=Haloactinospora alba TaxID=405555 RepID=UPI00319E9194
MVGALPRVPVTHAPVSHWFSRPPRRAGRSDRIRGPRPSRKAPPSASPPGPKDDAALGGLDAARLDRHWAVDARSCVLLTQAFAGQHDARPGGAVTLLTSGQHLGPLPGEVAYAAAKSALAGITVTLADQLAEQGIRLNTINPGPVDTGHLTNQARRSIAPMFPFGRFGRPDDPARLIAWLATDEARWVTGQVINSEGGFGRWRPRGG